MYGFIYSRLFHFPSSILAKKEAPLKAARLNKADG